MLVGNWELGGFGELTGHHFNFQLHKAIILNLAASLLWSLSHCLMVTGDATQHLGEKMACESPRGGRDLSTQETRGGNE